MKSKSAGWNRFSCPLPPTQTRRQTIRPFRGPPGGAGGRGGFGDKFRKGKRDDGGLRVNGDIYAPQVRLIDENGTMVGVMSSREALAIAESRGLDLIEIAPTATPPTCKIMDYGKWKYENKKKEKEAKKKQTVITVKEIQVRPRTDDHDIDVKVRHARRFLLEGDKVKVNLRFMGRELAHQEFGIATLRRVEKMLADIAVTESAPKVEGKQAFLLLAPDPVKVKEYLKTKPKPEAPLEPLEDDIDDGGDEDQ
ncbi:MAG: translation initiation factor IF-3 [Calothrix sp. SM1_5_4]|nr:translation initiation factor IF-3 [Calothrix sp. SM1_5_4]